MGEAGAARGRQEATRHLGAIVCYCLLSSAIVCFRLLSSAIVCYRLLSSAIVWHQIAVSVCNYNGNPLNTFSVGTRNPKPLGPEPWAWAR